MTPETRVEYESRLIGALKYSNLLIDTLGLEPDDFRHPTAKQAYVAMERIIRSGRQADAITVLDDTKDGILAAWIGMLPVISKDNALWCADKIREGDRMESLKVLAGNLKSATESEDTNSGEVLESIEKAITDLSARKHMQVQWLKDVLKAAVDDIERRTKAGQNPYTGVPTGYFDLDRMTDGFQNGELVIVAGRPSLGKTAFAISLLVNVAVRGKVVCGFFSCEMSEVLIAQRFLANAGKFNLTDVRSGTLARRSGAALLSAANELYGEHILLNATPSIRLSDLKSMARYMVRRGAKMIVIDYLTLIQHGDSKIPRHERVGEVSKNLKALARELNIPVVVLSQLARTAEGKEPNLAEIRQSGEIEEDADVVILIHGERPKEEEEIVPVKFIIAKNRNGPCGQMEMMFFPRSGRFELAERR